MQCHTRLELSATTPAERYFFDFPAAPNTRTDNGMGLLNFREFFTNPNQRAVARNTILLGLSMTFTCGTIGILLALYMTFLCGKYKKLIHILLLSPMMVPGVITVISFIQLYGESGILTKAIEYALPMLLTSNEVAIRGLHPSLEEAAHSLGADMLRTFSHVILPNIAPGIMAGGILILIRMIGEYTMSALLYGVYNRPISISIITNMQEYNVGISLAYGVLVIAICYASLALIFKLDD